MADVMVTARMPEEKKEKVHQVFAKFGTNASQTINRLYDYVIDHGELPFSETKRSAPTKEDWLEAASVVDGLSRTTRHSAMTDDEIKRERMITRGYMQEDDLV